MQLLPEEMDVPPAMAESVDPLRPLAEQRKIHLDVQCPPDLGAIRADRVKFSQVIVNLVGNALKFSPEGSTVRISARREGKDVLLCVADRGVGIPADARQLIFESFRQVDGSHTRRFGGTG